MTMGHFVFASEIAAGSWYASVGVEDGQPILYTNHGNNNHHYVCQYDCKYSYTIHVKIIKHKLATRDFENRNATTLRFLLQILSKLVHLSGKLEHAKCR